ncbi:MAG: hypothetical protein OZSIB_2382 [Candidatus Ozemobacter sibiricus]|jgi:hypothetical protein|uniref:Uncharacterized protein n=1 Tax=Candidatus Ozemobacter sibiricus TaxID=2268124 RepID=A0A367ZS86_9BACT|nr:MAG: hypothetical protein OZSIB_2382 [Candidatus Ozemobacter sibiricus]
MTPNERPARLWKQARRAAWPTGQVWPLLAIIWLLGPANGVAPLAAADQPLVASTSVDRPPERGGGRPERAAERCCETCGCAIPWGFETCFYCLQQSAAQRTLELGRWALDRSRQALQALQEPGLTDRAIERLLQVKQDWLQRHGNSSDADQAARREGLRQLGRRPVGADGRTVDDVAREAVRRLLPALEGTDLADDPVRVLSYYLVLDAKGFLKEVRFLRGPLGEPMTVLEAIEYHRRLNPGQARELLELAEDLQRLSRPDCPAQQVPLLLDAVGRTLKVLLNK